MNRFGLRFVALLLLMVTSVLLGFGQTSKGILVGVVRDATGAVIPNVTVKVVGQSDGATRTIATKGDGSYRIEALAPENYTVTANQPGFAGFIATDVIVTPSQVTSYDLTLNVGSTKDIVSVEADSISINTENGQLTGIVNSTDLEKLPIFSLSPYELATTVPGAQVVRNNGMSNGQGLQVNGARPRANNWLLDSQEINDVGIGGQAFQPAIPDSYESVAVLTSAASAEYGRAGGAVVNLVTKQGTNTYHGEVYERYTGSGLDAIGGQERGSTGITKSRFNTHTYGFTAGGPIFKNKLFVFGGLELQRVYGKEIPSVLELPDAAGYATLQAIGKAAAGSSTPITATQVTLLDSYLSNGSYLTTYNPVAGRRVVTTNVGPQPGCPTTGCIVTENFFQRPAPNQNNPDTQWTYRIDYKPWEKDSFTARYLHDRSSLTPDFFANPGALVGFDTLQGGPSELGEGAWTHVFTPNLLNEFRVSETRLSFAFAPTPATQANPLFALATINISGLPSLGPNQNFPQGRGEDLYQLQDTVGWTKGRQSFRIGADIGRQLETDLVSQNAKGTLGFAKGGVSANGNNYITALGNFLQNQLGPSGTATKTFGPTRIDPHGWRSGVFAQDDIKFNADLTINFGIRYDYLTNPENSLQYPGLDPANPLAILQAPAVAGNPATAVVYKIKNDKNNISPRFGFAYAPHYGGLFGDGKSVVRGGFGIFYDSDFSNFVTNAAQTAPNAPTGTLISTTGAGLTNATSLIPTIPAFLTLTSSVTGVVNNMVNPVTYQYNLGVEHQFPANIFLAIRYVGARSNKLFANQQYNYFSGLTGKRLNPSYGAIVARGNFADSNYNSLQVEGAHLFSHGFQIRGNYTFSKNLDDGSEIFTTSSSPTSYTANLAPGGRGQDYGPSAYDHRHYFVVSYVWSPAGFHSDNLVANAALGALTRHWTVSGISKFQSGTYSTYSTSGLDINGDGSNANDRPIVSNRNAPLESAGIDGHFVGGTTGTYYDVAANNATGALTPVDPTSVHFLVPYGPANQFLLQEIGRNSYSNPGLMQNDVALQKGIGLSYLHFERGQLILRAEAQDIANHNNIGVLNTNTLEIGDGNFLNRKNGLSDAGRTMVLWAKVVF
jgi:outer membrane receptor protein involved in Fe transport